LAAEAKHRDAIVAAAANLFRQRGFSATGMNDIVAESGAPKGSVYHYFPEGKAQIGAEALGLAGRFLKSRILALAETEQDPAVFLRGVMENSANALAKSDFRNGCTVAAVVLDTPPTDTRIMQAANDALALWRETIEHVCTRAGIAPDRAGFIASVAISGFEGAMIQARVARDLAPMHAVAEALAMLVAAELSRAEGQNSA
jgi:TetR/AcrR family transcriptional regulator, lmrAB and yxaGH operons repressor